jgi:hypothetical protein
MNLQRLDISWNQLSGTPRISSSARSKLLAMSSGNIPETLGNLTKLTQLWLSENQLSGTYPRIPSSIPYNIKTEIMGDVRCDSIFHWRTDESAETKAGRK